MRYGILVLLAAAPAGALVWGVSVSGGFAAPVGDYAEIVGASAVAEGRGALCFTPNLSLTVGVAYRLGHEPKGYEGSEEAAYDVIPVSLGATYRFEYLPLMPYAGGGVTVALCQATVPTAAGPEDRDNVRIGGYLEGGSEYYLGDNFGLDVRGRLVSTFGGKKVTYNENVVDAADYSAFEGLLGFFLYP